MDNQQVVLYGAITLAVWQIITIIVRLTPTPKDDEIVSWIGKFLNVIIQGARTKNAEVDKAMMRAQQVALYELNQTMSSIGQADMFRAAVKKAAAKTALAIDTPREFTGNYYSNQVVNFLLKLFREEILSRRMQTRFGKMLQRQLRFYRVDK